MALLDELRARFFAQFLISGRARLARAQAVLSGGRDAEAGTVIAELHSFAGEAALLGLDALVDAGRAAEEAARRWRAGEPDGRAACVGALRVLRRALDGVDAEASGR